jgi:predicted P-loop ATPase
LRRHRIPDYVREYRLRRDEPDFEMAKGGGFKEKGKYLSPPGRGNMLYFPPDVAPEWLADVSLPIIITESEKKCLALWELAGHDLPDAAEKPHFLPIAIPGVWNWRGVIGKAEGPYGERRDIKGVIPDFDRISWANRSVTILFDTNVRTNDRVRTARDALARELRQRGSRVSYVDLPAEAGVNGVDDLLGQWGTERVFDFLSKTYNPNVIIWEARLLIGAQNEILSRIENFAICLEQHPEWLGALRFNEFSNRVIVEESAPAGIQRGPLDDHTVIDIRCWLERYFLPGGDEKVRAAIDKAARLHSFHPVRNYIEQIKWDQRRRLERFFQTYFGAAGNDHYLAEVATMFLISAVARVFWPGCQADHLLVLEGRQGIYKSQGLRALFGAEYFTDQMPNLDSKDASLQLRGKWLIEFAEFDTLSKHEPSTVKAYVTRRVDVYRPPYGRQTVEVPRQTVFAATVNLQEYLTDEENRRFWPVRCGWVDVAALERDRDQIWGEAYALYRRGAIWWPDGELKTEFEQEQEARQIESPYLARVVAWLDKPKTRDEIVQDPKWLTTSQILDGLQIPAGQLKSVEQQVTRVMKQLKYKTDRIGRGKPRFWVRTQA